MPAPEQKDPLITISEDERKEWKKLREAKKLSTRALAGIAKVSNATITNIEVGTQRQAKRSVYVAIYRALHRTTENAAEALADEAIERNDAAIKRLVRAIAALPVEQVEAIALGVESTTKRK